MSEYKPLTEDEYRKYLNSGTRGSEDIYKTNKSQSKTIQLG